MIASLQLLHTLSGCYGERRFGEIAMTESRDFVLIDVTQNGFFFFFYEIDFLVDWEMLFKTTINLPYVRLQVFV